jgi:predicted metalloprotease with PDZ domain
MARSVIKVACLLLLFGFASARDRVDARTNVVGESTKGSRSRAQFPTEYRLSFTNDVHHEMQVEATFHGIEPSRLRVEMCRSSPGRYAAIEFAKNMFDEQFTDGSGKLLKTERPNPREWDVARGDGTIQITYRVFGDRTDGTFLNIDTTHAHINFPAILMWAPSLANQTSRVTFVLPPGSGWKIGTQLYPTEDPLTFTAPNLQYLMDSPVELSNFAIRKFAVPPLVPGGKSQTVRVAMHHIGTDAELDGYVADFEKIVREEQAVFGELPDFEPGYYTLLADYLPSNQEDGMEHRNSSVITGRGTLSKDQKRMLRNAAHEFFHCWNVKRIRPASLEPFNFEDANMSGELWLAEGFTEYYRRLAMLRSGLEDFSTAAVQMSSAISYVNSSPGTRFRSAVDMSRLAPFTDVADGSNADPTYWDNTFVSYYSFGDVIALGLDLMLRARSDSRVTLDDLMRAMWNSHGKRVGPASGSVSKPYTLADVRQALAQISHDKLFADEFFDRYVEGVQKIDYSPLLLRAGLVLRRKNLQNATLGPVRLDKKSGTGLKLVSPTIIGSPLYEAGVDLDDELLSIAGVVVDSPADLSKSIADRKPGDEVEVVFRRRGQEIRTMTRLAPDDALEIVPLEATGAMLTDEQKHFRNEWLSSKARP